MSELTDSLVMSDLMSNRNMLNTTYNTLVKYKNKRRIEPWTLDIKDVVDYVPVHKRTIYNWVKIGYFPNPAHKRVGRTGKDRWSMSDVISFLDKCIGNDNSYKDHINKLENKA